MTIPVASLADELRHDFLQARAQLAEARLDQAEKDTLEARAAVARWLSFIDALLDMYLSIRGRERTTQFSSSVSCGSRHPAAELSKE